MIVHRGRKKSHLPEDAFAHDAIGDAYPCPQGKMLRRSRSKAGRITQIETERFPYHPCRSGYGPCLVRADRAPAGLRKISRSIHERVLGPEADQSLGKDRMAA